MIGAMIDVDIVRANKHSLEGRITAESLGTLKMRPETSKLDAPIDVSTIAGRRTLRVIAEGTP